jgi:hypothetical protein
MEEHSVVEDGALTRSEPGQEHWLTKMESELKEAFDRLREEVSRDGNNSTPTIGQLVYLLAVFVILGMSLCQMYLFDDD